MAKKPKAAKTLSKTTLLSEIDEKLQALNLLRSALQADPSHPQESLENYKKQFYTMINK